MQVIQQRLPVSTTNHVNITDITPSTANFEGISSVKRVSIVLPSSTSDISGQPPVQTSTLNTIKKSSLTTENTMNTFVSNIDNKVAALRAVFRAVDPLQERQLMACKIQALIRRFLAKCRFQHHKNGVKEFRWIRCRPVIWLLDILLANQVTQKTRLFNH